MYFITSLHNLKQRDDFIKHTSDMIVNVYLRNHCHIIVCVFLSECNYSFFIFYDIFCHSKNAPRQTIPILSVSEHS